MTNKKQNLEKLKTILEQHPNTKFIYFKRLGGDFVGDVIDQPLHLAEWTVNQYPLWELMESEEQMDEDIASLFEDDLVQTPVPLFAVPSIPEKVSDEEFNKVMKPKIEDSTESFKQVDVDMMSKEEDKPTELTTGKAVAPKRKYTRKNKTNDKK